MAEGVPAYERLPGKGSGAMALLRTSRCTLWLGPDHLLSVDNHGYSEDYKRFFLKDIQAITVVRTSAATAWAWALGSLAAVGCLLLLLSLLLDWPAGAAVASGVFTAFFLLCLLVNRLRGPTCNCALRTAVQTERLHSLNRLRRALRVTARLREVIESVQGALTPEDAASLQSASEAAMRAAPPPAQHAPPHMRAVARHPYRSRAQAVLVGVLLADLIYEVLQFISPGPGVFFLGLLVSFSLIAATVVALIKQHSTTLPRGLKMITWLSMGYLFVAYLFGTIYMSVFMMSDPEMAGNTWKAVQAMAVESPMTSPARFVMAIFSICCSACLGVTGAVLLATRRTVAAAAPTPDEA